ncbi:MAG: glycosyltransferase [Candidatus Methylacidiphilales bacterium]
MKISIVTPCLNNVEHLQAALESVLQQPGPTEYIIADRGSVDGSLDVIKRYESRLASWTTEPDGAEYEALNRAFAASTGEIIGWLPATDIYLPWTLQVAREIFTKFPDVSWIGAGHKTCINVSGSFAEMQRAAGFSRRAFWAGKHGGRENRSWIQPEVCFWRRSLWDKIGGVVPSKYHHGTDFHLWSLMWDHAPLTSVEVPLAGFRFQLDHRITDSIYLNDVDHILEQGPVNTEAPSYHREMHVIEPTFDVDPEAGASQTYALNVYATDEFIDESDDLENSVAQKDAVIKVLDDANKDLRAQVEAQRANIQGTIDAHQTKIDELEGRLRILRYTHPGYLFKSAMKLLGRGKSKDKAKTEAIK